MNEDPRQHDQIEDVHMRTLADRHFRGGQWVKLDAWLREFPGTRHSAIVSQVIEFDLDRAPEARKRAVVLASKYPDLAMQITTAAQARGIADVLEEASRRRLHRRFAAIAVVCLAACGAAWGWHEYQLADRIQAGKAEYDLQHQGIVTELDRARNQIRLQMIESQLRNRD